MFLNSGIRETWIPDKSRPEIPWPYTVQSNTLTVTAGIIAYNLIGFGDFWRIWSENPGPYIPVPTAYPIPDRSDTGGIYPQSPLASVWVFWRPIRPIWTGQIYVAAQLYTLGSYVYDPQFTIAGTSSNGSGVVTTTATSQLQVGQAVVGPGVPANTQIFSISAGVSFTMTNNATSAAGAGTFTIGTGNVFMCILNNVLGNTILDPTKWTPQTIADVLVQILLWRAEGFRQASKGNDPGYWFGKADQATKDEIARVLPENGPPPPWDFSASAP